MEVLVEIYNDIDDESILFIKLDGNCSDEELKRRIHHKLRELEIDDILETFPYIIHRNWRIENE